MAGNKSKLEKYLFLLPQEALLVINMAYKIDITYGLMFDITFNGGFRISETLNLTPLDFNYPENKIYVNTLKQKKDKKNTRVGILVPENTMRISRKFIEQFKIKDTEKIFPFSRQWAWKKFKSVCIKVGLSSLYSPHALRHAHGLAVRDACGGDLTKIANRLRHSNANNAYKYIHLLDTDQQDIVSYLEKIKDKKQNNKT